MDFSSWYGRVSKKVAKGPVWTPVASDTVQREKLTPHRDYFRVRVYRFQLAWQQQLLETYAPMLVVAADFTYDGQPVSRSTTIGPSTIEHYGLGKAPLAHAITGTVVAGPHPLKSPLTITVALCRVKRGNVADKLLSLVESLSGALDLAGGIAPYTKIADLAVSGLSVLAGEEGPILAQQNQFVPVESGMYALLDPEADVDPDRLVVQGQTLYQQHTDSAGVTSYDEVQGVNYVLYGVEKVPWEEIELERLPLHGLWKRMRDEASRWNGDPTIGPYARMHLGELVATAQEYRDLAQPHVEQLVERWKQEALDARAMAAAIAKLGPGDAPDADRQRVLAVLDL